MSGHVIKQSSLFHNRLRRTLDQESSARRRCGAFLKLPMSLELRICRLFLCSFLVLNGRKSEAMDVADRACCMNRQVYNLFSVDRSLG
eukprot:4054719-Amphidinium_carterae.1